MSRTPSLYDRIKAILESAHTHISRTVNTTQVIAYWLVGREIVEEEQKGKKRAAYGKKKIESLSMKLQATFGKGYSGETEPPSIMDPLSNPIACGESRIASFLRN